MAAREDFFTTFSLEFLIELSYEFCGFLSNSTLPLLARVSILPYRLETKSGRE